MKAFLVSALLTAASQPSQAAASLSDNDAMCQMYGIVGASAVDFMLPMTFGKLLNAIRGNDPKFQGEVAKAILQRMPPELVVAVGKLPQGDMRDLGEAAGQQAFTLLMAGTASNSDEISMLLQKDCRDKTAAVLLARHRQAKELTATKVD